MGAIKDITDLSLDLVNSIKDSKLAAKMAQIQNLIATLQSEHSAIIEKNTDLLSENLDLKNMVLELEKEIFNFKQEISNEISKLRDKYIFNKTYGIYKSKEADHYFCTSCLLKNIESPLTECEMG